MEQVKILVVDDDAVVRHSCQRVLEAEGSEVRLVFSADKALEAMAHSAFDLLLVDVKMPGHDGMWLTREVKEQWPEVPIVVMSGYPTPETILDGLELGAARFLAKPFAPDELIEAVRETLGKE